MNSFGFVGSKQELAEFLEAKTIAEDLETTNYDCADGYEYPAFPEEEE